MQVGQHVVYLGGVETSDSGAFRRGDIINLPEVGKVYTIEYLLSSPEGNPHLELIEVKPYHKIRGSRGFIGTRFFRPLTKLSVEDFIKIKEPVG